MKANYHPLSDVQSPNIGEGTKIWQYAIILKGAVIGGDCNINCHTFIENDVVIGNNVTVKSGIYIWDGIRIADNVFLGPNVSFTNDKYPRSKKYPSEFQITTVEENASIGAGCIIMGGVTIGKNSLIAAGTVVTKSVPPYSLVIGNPGRIKGKVDKDCNIIERY